MSYNKKIKIHKPHADRNAGICHEAGKLPVFVTKGSGKKKTAFEKTFAEKCEGWGEGSVNTKK